MTEEDPFTFKEVSEIHYRQQEDPFEDILNTRNDAKLDFLKLKDKFNIRDLITDLDKQRLNVKAFTVASSSRRDDETEIGLFNKQTRIFNDNKNEDNESVANSNQLYQDDQNLENDTSVRNDSSYANLIKMNKSHTNIDGSEGDEEELENDTGRPLNTEIMKGTTAINDFFKVCTNYNFKKHTASAFSHRVHTSLRDATPKNKKGGSPGRIKTMTRSDLNSITITENSPDFIPVQIEGNKYSRQIEPWLTHIVPT